MITKIRILISPQNCNSGNFTQGTGLYAESIETDTQSLDVGIGLAVGVGGIGRKTIKNMSWKA